MIAVRPKHSAARLGVNIDHVATLRQLRGTPYPDLVEAAKIVETCGADQITVHLREDRRHIQDADVISLRKTLKIPLNLEMALSESILRFALKHRPDWVCIVPEKRQEVTTEGGLDVRKAKRKLERAIPKLRKAGIKVSLFIEPDLGAVKLSTALGADAVELHTGSFCKSEQKGRGKPASHAANKAAARELERIRKAALSAKAAGLGVHAGHGFDDVNVRPVVELRDETGRELIEEYNIGHAIVCRAALVGLRQATLEMKAAVQAP